MTDGTARRAAVTKRAQGYARRLAVWMRGEVVLCIAAACALVSMVFVPPDAVYASYIDLRVLVLLFCLMATVAGLKASGLFDALAKVLLQGERSFRLVAFTLVMLPFFASMLVTNDVALLAFVPFSVLVLKHAGRPGALAWVVVLQTVAANLGGMATPVGNPQNLFVFLRYNVQLGEFMALLAPYVVVSFAALTAASLASGRGRAAVAVPLETDGVRPKRLVLHGALFVLCLLAVVRVLDPLVLLAAVVVALALLDRPSLRAVDYGLLLTFVCFFVFAAVLLSGFTSDWQGLLLGVDIGGLGTPVASLASLIALRIYLHADGAHFGRFMATFAAVNVAFLVLLLMLQVLLG